MLLRSGLRKTPTEESRPLPLDGNVSEYRDLNSTCETNPSSQERRVNRLRRQRSPCPEPEDKECTEISAAEFYRTKKRVKTVDLRYEDKDKCTPNTRSGGLVENTQSLERPTNSGTLRSSPDISLCRARNGGAPDGGFTAINRDWPSYRALRSSTEMPISTIPIGKIIATNQAWTTTNVKMSLRGSEIIDVDESSRPTQEADCITPEDANSLTVNYHSSTTNSSSESSLLDSGSGREPERQVGYFQGTTVHHPREVALKYAFAKQNSRATSCFRPEIVLWVDGSGKARRAGDAVAWRVSQDSEVWKIRARHLSWTEDSMVTEMYAIAHGLEVAIEQIVDHQNARQTHTHSEVLVFSDCLSAIQKIGSSRDNYTWKLAYDKLLAVVDTRTAQLRLLGARVELHWVPGHAGVLGNELSDLAAFCAGKRDAIDLSLVIPRGLKPGNARTKLHLAIIQLAAEQAQERRMSR